MNNFSDIVAFVRVVEAHSFVAAAQTLGMSPSAISKAVSRLEERLGARLLNRTTRSLSLTDLGTGFYERCREALGQLDRGIARPSHLRRICNEFAPLKLKALNGVNGGHARSGFATCRQAEELQSPRLPVRRTSRVHASVRCAAAI